MVSPRHMYSRENFLLYHLKNLLVCKGELTTSLALWKKGERERERERDKEEKRRERRTAYY